MLTREEAFAAIDRLLTDGDKTFSYVKGHQGPGYTIEQYSDGETTIWWGEDDPDWDLSAYAVSRGGESHQFSADDVREIWKKGV
jgi:hypothetical protein